MKTFAITIDLKDDPQVIALYDQYHSQVWPEVRKAVEAIGVRNVKIFRLGTRLVQIFEAADNFDPRVDMPKYAEGNETVQKWDSMMSDFQVPLPDRKPGEGWALMTLVYDSNWNFAS
jgi:L-rhamnose mutarotase